MSTHHPNQADHSSDEYKSIFFKGINTRTTKETDILEEASSYELVILSYMIKAASSEIENKARQNYVLWIEKINKLIATTISKLKEKGTVTILDQYDRIDESTKVHEGGARKKVFCPEEGDKVYATSKKDNVFELLTEVVMLDKLSEDGLNVPRTYLGGFSEHNLIGFPLINVPKKNNTGEEGIITENLGESKGKKVGFSIPEKKKPKKVGFSIPEENDSIDYHKVPAFAMDKLSEEHNFYKMWDGWGRFENQFIKQKQFSKGFKLTEQNKNKLCEGLNDILDYTETHIINDLQIHISNDGEVTVVDPVTIYNLNNPYHLKFLEEYREQFLTTNENLRDLILRALETIQAIEF